MNVTNPKMLLCIDLTSYVDDAAIFIFYDCDEGTKSNFYALVIYMYLKIQFIKIVYRLENLNCGMNKF